MLRRYFRHFANRRQIYRFRLARLLQRNVWEDIQINMVIYMYSYREHGWRGSTRSAHYEDSPYALDTTPTDNESLCISWSTDYYRTSYRYPRCYNSRYLLASGSNDSPSE
jgi:hypothetical protein